MAPMAPIDERALLLSLPPPFLILPFDLLHSCPTFSPIQCDNFQPSAIIKRKRNKQKMIGQIIVLDPKKYLLVTRCPPLFQIQCILHKDSSFPKNLLFKNPAPSLLSNCYPVSADSHKHEASMFPASLATQSQNSKHSYGMTRIRFSVPAAGRRWAPDDSLVATQMQPELRKAGLFGN